MDNYWKLWKNADKVFFVIAICFAILSITMITSISCKNGQVAVRDIVIQSIAYGLGFFAVAAMILFDYRKFQDFSKALYIGSLLFLLTVYIPGLGIVSNGARSWIDLGFTTLQPSEIVKISFTILMANYFSRNKSTLRQLSGVILAALYAAPFILIVVKEDLGSAIVYCFIWVFMIFFAGIDHRIFARFAVFFLLSLPIAYGLMAPYQKRRIDAFLHPSDLGLPGNYHVWNSKVAIGSGGFFGKGLFAGTQKELDFLPVQKSDFIFSVIVEELGMLGGALVILLFAVFLYRTAKVVYRAADLYGALLSIGFLGMFLFQVFENIAMTMGIMPVTGVTLPFISYGGSSVLSGMAALGLIVSVGIRGRRTGL
ncbi:rod shape-determining protein RodA [Anaerovorax odorimutans]|uniref:Rod shape-determining protein RodA n=1 Tax=Anaerovorax odorimutans TaxID=109327 RepID=A0ABT1RSA1_9FIRM|nr:FtsW/RodA/SpoVE family cell cycle protein [Anaerovorax odorimutans]MCQ4638089.1 rod shape-determining protein RodA [Anaerovorax odorimutans]